MTREECNALLCAVLSTLAETNGSPESVLYCGLGCDMAKWETLRGIMLAGQLVSITGNYVTLTERGREIAAKIDALVKA